MLQLGNYVILSGHQVKIKELYQQELLVELEDRTLLRTDYASIRFIELGSNVLCHLMDDGKKVCRLLKSTDFDLHRKEDYEINLRGKRFYLHGFLYNDISIWQILNVLTIHYLHQLQNVTKILCPGVDLTLV